MSVGFCVAVLALCSLTAASDPDCEVLVKPLEDQSQLSGKWIFHAGTSDNKLLLDKLKTINSSWITLSLIPSSENMTLRWGDKANGKCYYGGSNTSISGNITKVSFNYNSTTHEHVGRHLMTCPDCIVWTDELKEDRDGETRDGRSLYLFTKTGALDASPLQDFKKQAACLNFPQDFHFGESTDLCPEDEEEEEQ